MGSAVGNQFIVELEDGQAAVIQDTEEAQRLHALVTSWEKVPARITLRDSDDVEGHSSSNTVAITLEIEGDTEGHALSLRFPTADAARDFEKRMLATGLLVGTVAATAIGIGVGQGIQSTVSPIAAPAPIVQTGPATRDMDKDLTLPTIQIAPATRDMDKELAPAQIAPATRDMDKELAPAQ